MPRLELPWCWHCWFWPRMVPVTLFHYVLEGWAQLLAWQKNEKFDCNLGFSHYSLNAVKVSWQRGETKQKKKSCTFSSAESAPDELLLVWLVELVEVKLTAIDRPGRPWLLFTSNQPQPLIMSEVGTRSPNYWWTPLLDYLMTCKWAALKLMFSASLTKWANTPNMLTYWDRQHMIFNPQPNRICMHSFHICGGSCCFLENAVLIESVGAAGNM